MKNIAVFCASSTGHDPDFLKAAQGIGPHFKRLGVGMVYGGASVGLMGACADSCLAAGVPVIGVQPKFLDQRELTHTRLTETIIVHSMHERKAIMADRSDAFLCLPGGIGTLDEMAEIFTWAVLGLHQKPFGLLNVNGYYTPLVAFLDHMVAQGTLQARFRSMLFVDTDLARLLQQFADYQPMVTEKYLKRDQV